MYVFEMRWEWCVSATEGQYIDEHLLFHNTFGSVYFGPYSLIHNHLTKREKKVEKYIEKSDKVDKVASYSTPTALKIAFIHTSENFTL